MTSLVTFRRQVGQEYQPLMLSKVNYLVVDSPVYPGGGVMPTTAAARNAAVLGAVGLTTRPGFELTQALAGHAGTALTFYDGSGSAMVTFKAGRAPAGAQSAMVDLRNGWHVQVFAAVDGPGVLGNWNALALVLAGLVLSLLLGALIYVLGTGRSRALGLVDKRTRELHHLAPARPTDGSSQPSPDPRPGPSDAGPLAARAHPGGRPFLGSR